jgi:uncharacterized membrane protein
LEYLPLAIVVSIAAGLRFYFIERNSLWLDEHTSLDVATKSLSDIVTGKGFNSHTPPFYYVVLHFWLLLFEQSETALRSFSVVFDLLNIVLLYRISLRITRSDVNAFSVAFLYAISPFAIYFAQDGRMYTMLVFLCLLTSQLLLRFPFSSRRLDISFVVLAICGMYTHYYYALFLASGSLAVMFASGLTRKQQLHYVVLGVLVAVGFVPWLGVIATLVKGSGQDFREHVWSVIPYAFFRFSAGYGIMTLNTTLKSQFKETIIDNAVPIVMYCSVFAGAIFWGLRCLYRRASQRFYLVLSFLVGPAVLALMISLFTPMLSERYLLVSFPFFLLPIGLLSGTVKEKLLFYTCFLMTCYALHQHMTSRLLRNTNWRGAAFALETSIYRCHDVVVNPDYTEGLTRYYLPDDWKFKKLRDVIDDPSKKCVWLLERGTAETMITSLEEKGFSEKYREHYEFENELDLVYLERCPEDAIDKSIRCP